MIKRLLSFVVTLIVFLTTPGMVLAATLSLSPSSGSFNTGCSYSLDIKLDTGGVSTDGTDAIIFYDASKMTVNSITTGKIYSDYPISGASNGKISVSGITSSPSQSFSGTGTLATINFSISTQTSTAPMVLTFDFDPNNPTKTTDSNVAQSGTLADVLSSVVNGNYTIGTGNCTGGTTPSASASPGAGVGTGTGTGGIGGPIASGSASPIGKLPPAGATGPTLILTIAGSILTILGIAGLALL